MIYMGLLLDQKCDGPDMTFLYILSRAREAGSPSKAAARAGTRECPTNPVGWIILRYNGQYAHHVWSIVQRSHKIFCTPDHLVLA